MHRYFAGILLFFSFCSFATSIDDRNFAELLNSDDVYSDAQEVSEAEEALWKKYVQVAKNDSERFSQHEGRALRYGDKTMKFSLERISQAPASGYPVYIALHGGGGAPASVSNSSAHA